MTAFTRRGASLLGLAVVLVLVPVAARIAWVSMKPVAAAATGGAEIEATLIRCGLDAEALAAAGLTANEVAGLVAALDSAIGEAPNALGDANAALASARVSSDALTRQVASGLASQDEVTALASAKSALASAEAARDAVLDGLFNDATTGLAQAKIDALTLIRANRDQRLPVEFLTKTRDHTEWHALRKALNNERVCAKIGDEPDPTMQTSLSTWRAEPSCANAKSACDTNGDAVKAAWDSAIEG